MKVSIVADSMVALQMAKLRLTEVVENIFAGRPDIDRRLAIGAGHRALERGEAFFEAVEIAEGVLNLWREVVHDTRQSLIARRNVERLTEYRIKRAGYLAFKLCIYGRPHSAGAANGE